MATAPMMSASGYPASMATFVTGNR
jgi:hypothetical protein